MMPNAIVVARRRCMANFRHRGESDEEKAGIGIICRCDIENEIGFSSTFVGATFK